MSDHENNFHTSPQHKKFFDGIHGLLVRMAPTVKEEQQLHGHVFTPRERAELRRMNAVKDRERPPFFWKLLCEYEIIGTAEGSESPQSFSLEHEKAWAAVLQGMALTAENCRDAPEKKDFGAALGSIEGAGDALARRFDQLMRSRGDRFLDLLRCTLKMANSKGCAFSWESLARLCVTDSDEERSCLISRLIKSFYLALWKSKSLAEENSDTTFVKEND